MRYMIGSQIGWGIVPALVVVGAAYLWIVERLLSKKPVVRTSARTSSAQKAA